MAYLRKLEALGYMKTDDFNVYSNEEFRCLIVWLEDQYIRHYPIEDRTPLRKVASDDWELGFKNYLDDLSCPYSGREEITDWLLGLGIRLEYGDNIENYRGKVNAKDDLKASNTKESEVKYENVLDAFDFESPPFKGYVKAIAQILNVSPHPLNLETFIACCTAIHNTFPEAAVNKIQSNKKSGKPPSSAIDMPLGFETKDFVLDKAAKVLRLCFIHDLRDLQTKINEIIVSVQNITANPKTDTRLGKVGR